MTRGVLSKQLPILLLLPNLLTPTTTTLLKLLPLKGEPGHRHLLGTSSNSQGSLVSERAVVEVGEEEEVLVVMPGDNLLLQCSGPVAEVRRCVWFSPGSSTTRCCFGDCGSRQRRCGGEGRQVRMVVRIILFSSVKVVIIIIIIIIIMVIILR